MSTHTLDTFTRATMRKPDITFKVYVCPIVRVHHCATVREQESRGLFGFHSSAHCPDCQCATSGYELWGENGHLQGRADTRAQLAHVLKAHARKQWIGSKLGPNPGALFGYVFRVGSEQRYLA